MGAVPDIEVVSGSRLTLDTRGHIEDFTVWLEFPEPIDVGFSNSHISLFVYGRDEVTLDSPDLPYRAVWSDDNTTLTISSEGADLSEDDIFSFTVTISLPLRTKAGSLLWEDSYRSEIELNFGNSEELELDYGIWEVIKTFVLPFILLVIVLIVIEVLLRLTVRPRGTGKVPSTAETLLRLIERTERMLRIRLVITLGIVSFLIVAYLVLMSLALVQFTFAMVMTWAAIFYLSPWAILIVTSVLYLIFRREDLAWRKNLKLLRGQQRKFLKDIEKE
jgi:hypothetical protein